ncbi:MAG TPA: DNA polymerase domain-containing protein [Bacteroidota bacterium]|nr:DNA polymerase domain-containing protein [Bacteroidota bacterium]
MNELIFGHDDERNIVAVQPNGDASVRIYTRTGGSVEHRDEELYPFFHVADKRLLDGFPKSFWLKKLEGENFYQYLCVFHGIHEMWDAVRIVLENVNRTLERKIDSYTETDSIYFRPDTNTQYLMQSGKTLFKGMEFQDVYRIQLDIETYSKNYRFSNAERPEDRIVLISLSDNRGWETILGGKDVGEKDLLRQCINILQEKDPDVIEGHNILNFDLPYLLKRCEIHRIEFAVGRDKSSPHGVRSRTSFAENEVEYTNYEIAGRHVIDTWLLVQSYDMVKRSMENYTLKYAAKHFGISPPNRTYIPGEKISWYWDNDHETLKKYALDDVRETKALSDRLSMSTFYLTQMLPFNYGTVARLGSASKIEALFLRQYLRQRHSIPRPEIGAQTTGGYTDVYYTGVLGPIIHADVESLYPSIMISKQIAPRTDALGIFPTALRHLTVLRLQTKKQMKEAKEENEKSRLDAMQSSFKILVNSFYGYLGYARALFNDYAQADVVTTTGQALLKQMIRDIELHNGKVIEVDTDGLFFIPPDNVVGEASEQQYVARLSDSLPEGINLGFNGRYKKILSYKKKNYALLGYDDRITVKGSSLISRSMEHFGRHYVQQCIECIVNERIDDLHRLYLEVEKSIKEHSLDVKDFAKTESLKDSLEEYQRDVNAQKRNKSASYELALASSRSYRAGDRISFYFTGTSSNIRGFENAKEAEEWDSNFPDENVGYYLKRLEEFSSKFEPFFSEKDFRSIFSAEDLFGFDSSRISIVTRKLSEEPPSAKEWLNPEPSIWLDT